MRIFRIEKLTTPTSFRLLELLPGSEDTINKHRLSNHDLSSCPPYAALSYVCDELPGTDKIEINGFPASLRSSLVAFLRVLQSKISAPLVLWADEICINQRDIKELNQQVQLMRKIFSHAYEVKGLLGLAAPLTAEMVEAVRFCNAKGWNEPGPLHGMALNYNFNRHRQDFDVRIGAKETFAQLEILCGQRYWSRLWIMPELLLEKTVLLHCGNLTLNLDVLSTALQVLSDEMNPLKSYVGSSLPAPRGFPHTDKFKEAQLADLLWGAQGSQCTELAPWFEALQRMRQEVRDPSMRVSLHQLLYRYHTKSCLHGRDRVDALLGVVAAHSDKLPIKVDYASPPEKVFLETLDHCLRHDGWRNDTYTALCTSLDLEPGDCLSSLIHSPDLARYRQPCYETRLVKQANVGRRRAQSSSFGYDVLDTSRLLITNQEVGVGDTYCSG